MKVVHMSKVISEDRKDVDMKVLIQETKSLGGKVDFGIVKIPPGARIPLKGYGYHEGDEYSFVLKGSVLTESGGKQYRISSGHATFIPAKEDHWALNDSKDNCEILWVTVEV